MAPSSSTERTERTESSRSKRGSVVKLKPKTDAIRLQIINRYKHPGDVMYEVNKRHFYKLHLRAKREKTVAQQAKEAKVTKLNEQRKQGELLFPSTAFILCSKNEHDKSGFDVKEGTVLFDGGATCRQVFGVVLCVETPEDGSKALLAIRDVSGPNESKLPAYYPVLCDTSFLPATIVKELLYSQKEMAAASSDNCWNKIDVQATKVQRSNRMLNFLVGNGPFHNRTCDDAMLTSILSGSWEEQDLSTVYNTIFKRQTIATRKGFPFECHRQ